MWGHNSRKEYPWVEVVAIAPLERAGDSQHQGDAFATVAATFTAF